MRRDSRLTSCYTKAYGRYNKGTGSILLESSSLSPLDHETTSSSSGKKRKHMEEEGQDESSMLSLHEYDPDWLNKLLGEREDLYLRYLSPKELLRLFGFPEEFSFPSDKVTTRKCYELIGNSINITVASNLLERLLAKLNPN